MECCGRVGPANSHCGKCHQTFATLDLFDRHLVHERGSSVITGCYAPEGMGLLRDDHGTWRTPEGLARRNLDAARLAALRRTESPSEAGP